MKETYILSEPNNYKDSDPEISMYLPKMKKMEKNIMQKNLDINSVGSLDNAACSNDPSKPMDNKKGIENLDTSKTIDKKNNPNIIALVLIILSIFIFVYFII